MADAAGKVDILIVDDNPDQLVALEAVLEPLGQHIVRATSGDDALRQLLKGDFAVILLDVRMDGMSGLETAEVIKSRERTRLIPIIFITGMDDREEAAITRAYSAGAVDYIVKPFQPEVLRSKVSVFVELHRQQHRISDQERRLRESDRQQLELRHARELLQAETKYREILAAALDAIIVFDAGGKITMINGAAARMFGVTEKGALGAPIGEFVPEGIDDAIVRERCVRAGEAPGGLEGKLDETPRALTARRANGERFPIETSVSCLNGTRERSYTLIARDISDRVRSEAELKRVNEELQEGQRALEQAMTTRSRFFAAMSHELRTPINAVLGYTSLLRDHIYGPLNEKQAEGVRRVEKATQHLLEMVNDVLDLSKIEAGKIDLVFEPVKLPALIEELFVTVQPLADEHGSELSLDHAGDPITITSDPRRVRQIFFNLLSNAIKFGGGKPIHVVSRAADIGGGMHGVTVEVIDHGIGIAPADQERIFKEFEQVTKKTGHSGTGLGLAISRRLAEMLGGSLTLTSEPDKGSTFRVALPLKPSAATGRAAAQSEATPPRTPTPRELAT